ncbi:Fungal-type protein kinase domain-containing protein [Pleurotus pulmonarius]
MDATMDGDSSSRSSNEDYYYNYYCCDPADLHYSYSDDSSMSTPSKKGAAGVHNRTRPNMDSALKTDLSNLVVRDVDVEEYVQYVYGVSKNDISYIQSKKWELKGLSTYTEMLDKGANEDTLYEPFKNIMGDIFETLAKDGRKIDIHHASLGTKELKGTANVCKPDQLFFFGSHTDEMPVTWSLSKAFVEFTVTPKAHSLKAAILGQKFSTIKEEVAVAVGSAAPDAPAGSPTIFSSPDIATPPTIFSTPDLSALPTIPSTPPRTKRHSTGDANERPAKRPKLGPLTGKAPQAAGYALELMASTCRRWATGLVIIDKRVYLHYYDRVGAIFTAPFSFDKEPWKLALFALAIGQCDLVQAGFEPLIASDVDRPLSQPLISLRDAILKLPKADIKPDGQDGVEYAGGVGLGVWSHFKVTGGPLYVYGGVTGRGSHVLPGTLIATSNKETPPDTTKVADETLKSPAIPTSSEMVVKLSWPMTKRPCLEATTINELVEKLPWVAQYLPRVHCAITLKGESIGLPRNLFREMTIAFTLEQRYFTLLFTDRYRHLWELRTLEDFQVAYLDIVECHYTTTTYGNILHRDISENNLLWAGADGNVTGVLNDWDLATPVDAIGKSTNHRTGTGPFMALDLLDPVPPVHLYRHDLESLFYVLIRAAVHYDIGSGRPHSHGVDKKLENWTGTYEAARDAKALFIANPASVLDCIKPAWQPVRKTWLQPICALFYRAQDNANQLRLAQSEGKNAVENPTTVEEPATQRAAIAKRRRARRQSNNSKASAPPLLAAATSIPDHAPRDDLDFETLGGCLTFENFMAALNGSEPVGIPEEYEEYANTLLREPKQVDASGST